MKTMLKTMKMPKYRIPKDKINIFESIINNPVVFTFEILV